MLNLRQLKGAFFFFFLPVYFWTKISNFKTWNALLGEVLHNGTIYPIFIYSHTVNLPSLSGFFCQLKIPNSVMDITNLEHFKHWLLKVFLLMYTYLLCKGSLKDENVDLDKVFSCLKLFFFNIYNIQNFNYAYFDDFTKKCSPRLYFWNAHSWSSKLHSRFKLVLTKIYFSDFVLK